MDRSARIIGARVEHLRQTSIGGSVRALVHRFAAVGIVISAATAVPPPVPSHAGGGWGRILWWEGARMRQLVVSRVPFALLPSSAAGCFLVLGSFPETTTDEGGRQRRMANDRHREERWRVVRALPTRTARVQPCIRYLDPHRVVNGSLGFDSDVSGIY